jgi:hypothetical protein
LQHGLHRLDDETARVVAALPVVGEDREFGDQPGGTLAFDLAGIAPGDQVLDHQDQRLAGSVGQRVVVRHVGLGAICDFGRFFRLTVAFERHRQNAHRRAVAGVVLGGGGLRVAGAAKADQVAAHGVADIDRLGAHPGIEGFGGRPGVDAAGRKDGLAQGQRHRRVVGDLAGFQAQPAATGDVAVHADLVADFGRRQEFDGGAQRIADGQPDIGRHRPVDLR